MSDSSKPSKQEEQPTQRIKWPFHLFVELPSALLILSIGLLIIIILTPFGRTTISNLLIDTLPLPNNYQLQVSELTSPSIGRWEFKSLQLTQNNEAIADVKDGIIDWLPLRIIHRQFVIGQLFASEIIWHTPLGEANNNRIEQKKTKPPNALQDLNNPLEGLDHAIEKGLKKFASQLIPISIEHITLESLQVQYKETPLHIQTNGSVTIGNKEDFINISAFTVITHNVQTNTSAMTKPKTTHFRNPIAFHVNGSMNYERDIFISLNSEFSHQLKNKALMIKSMLNVSLHFQEKPFRIIIQPSRVDVNQSIFTLSGTTQLSPTGVSIKALALNGFDGQATLKGTINESNIDLQGAISQINLRDILPEGVQLTANGSFNISGHPQEPMINGSLATSGIIHNEATHLTSDFLVSTQALQLTDLSMKLGQASATAVGVFQFKDKQLEITAKPKNLQLSQLAQFNIPIPKALNVSVEKATTQIHYTFPDKDKKPLLKLHAQGLFSGDFFSVPAKTQAEISADLDALYVHHATIDIIDTQATAKGFVNWRKNIIDLHFLADKVTPKTIQWLPVSIPETIEAQLHADIRLSGQLKKPNITLQATGPLRYQNLQLNSNCQISTDLHSILIEYCHLFDPLENNLKRTPQKLMSHSGTVIFKPLTLRLKHEFFLFSADQISQVFPTLLHLKNDFEIEGKLQGVVHSIMSRQHNKPLQPLELQQLKADIGFFGHIWSEPLFGGLRATANRNNDTLEFDIKSLGLDFGSETYATLKATTYNQTLELTLDGYAKSVDLKNVPFKNVAPFTQWPAQLRIKSHAFGPLTTPQIEGAIEYIADIQQINTLGKNSTIPFKLIASFEKPETQPLKLSAQIYKEQQQQSEFSLETNWLTNVLAKILTHQPPQPLKISSKGQMDLENLNLLLSPVFHQFSGFAFWNWSWDQGNPADLQFTGDLEINNGGYQHLIHGTQFQQSQIRMAFKNNGIHIKKGSATDGASGTYALEGYLNINHILPHSKLLNSKAGANTTDIKLTLNQVQLVNRPDIESLANGEARLLSINNELSLEGKIQLQPLEIQLDRTQSDQIPEIEIIKFNPRFKSNTHIKKQQVPIRLKLDLSTHQQAYLRGKGINTELEGQVLIRGTTQAPKILGYFKTLRGDADILGKRFIINNGELRFEGYRGFLSIQATHSQRNQDFIAKVTGSLDNLNVSLESIPALPEDETLSQLLFGKSLDDISAIQALRIAAAVRSFSTKGSGLDPLATTRNLLGVDQVTIDSENTAAGQENYKLGVGKYVSDKVYVEIQRSTDPTEPWQGKVQIELTPNISLDTSAESNGGFSGLDITWKRDY